MPRNLPARLASAARLAKPFQSASSCARASVPAKSPEVVDLAGRRRVGQRLRLDQVLAAQRVGRHADFARGVIDRALDQIGRLGATGAAIGIDRHGVGIGRAQPHIGGRNVVGAGRHAHAEPGDVGRVAGQIGAHVGDDVELEREELALVVERELRGRDIVAAVAVAEEVLGAVAHPFHRLARASRRRPRPARIRDRETAWCRSRRRHRA